MGLPRWRKATWALVLWTGLIFVWMIAGVAGKDVLRRRRSSTKAPVRLEPGLGLS